MKRIKENPVATAFIVIVTIIGMLTLMTVRGDFAPSAIPAPAITYAGSPSMDLTALMELIKTGSNADATIHTIIELRDGSKVAVDGSLRISFTESPPTN